MAPTGTLAVGGTTWSKWQIALVVGTPVALGLGYWYLKRQPTREKPSKDDDEASKGRGTGGAIRHEPSLDTSEPPSVKSVGSGGDAAPTPQVILENLSQAQATQLCSILVLLLIIVKNCWLLAMWLFFCSDGLSYLFLCFLHTPTACICIFELLH